jgi:hypothetical protein
MPAQPPVWSSDVRISTPLPPEHQVLVPMFGFGMTEMGLFHDLTEVEYEYLRTPSYSPDLPTEEVIRGDRDVD